VGPSVLNVAPELLRRIAESVGTPTYVYVAGEVRRQWETLDRALADVPHRIHYSLKANGNLGVLRLLRALGAGADIVSLGELRRALRAGFRPEDLVFSGVGKRPDELAIAVREGVGLINLESVAELDDLCRVVNGEPVAVGIRVNPDVTTDTHPYTQTGEGGMKFGVPLDRVRELGAAIRAAGDRVTLRCLGMHLGSQIFDVGCYAQGAGRLGELVDTLRDDGVDSLTSMDVGGGLGVAYDRTAEFDAAEFVRTVAPMAVERGLRLLVEPGRFLVGEAGMLLTQVVRRKHSGGRDFLVVDAGMNDFVRPSYYQARHPVHVVTEVSTEPSGGSVDVVGPICETGDFLGRDLELPEVEAGGLLAVTGAGAYGFSMSSTYNTRPRAAEVLVDGDRYAVVRHREPLERLWADEVLDPDWESL